MTEPSNHEVICAACGHHASGRFCSNCGTSLEPAACAACGSALSPGARFCHNCGKSVGDVSAAPGAPSGKRARSSLAPWMVGAVALVVLLAFLAGSAFNRQRGARLDAPQNALPQAGLDDRGEPGVVRAPDISQLSPQESADRLFNRVMLLDSQGKSDSVLFFAPMAIQAYEMMAPLNTDQRYDMGKIAAVAGALPLAKAQADTILLQNPTHLLGLALAERVAKLDNRSGDAAALRAKLRSAYENEMAKKLPEYERHQDDIRAALNDATGLKKK